MREAPILANLAMDFGGLDLPSTETFLLKNTKPLKKMDIQPIGTRAVCFQAIKGFDDSYKAFDQYWNQRLLKLLI